jgi:hypothetical protein
MMVIAIASAEERDMDIGDVTAVFLECKMIDEVHRMLDRFLTAILVSICPEAAQFVNPDGT